MYGGESKMNQPNQMNAGAPQAQSTILLNIKFTPEEASIILNKLNAATFQGFTESSLAIAILGKIQNAEKIPAASMGPTLGQMKNIRESPPTPVGETDNLNDLRQVLSKEPVPPKTAPIARTTSVTTTEETPRFTSAPKIKEVVEEKPGESPIEEVDTDEDDARPGAPLKALDEAKAETPSEGEGTVNIPPEDSPAFGVIDNSAKKDGTDKYI